MRSCHFGRRVRYSDTCHSDTSQYMLDQRAVTRRSGKETENIQCWSWEFFQITKKTAITKRLLQTSSGTVRLYYTVQCTKSLYVIKFQKKLWKIWKVFNRKIKIFFSKISPRISQDFDFTVWNVKIGIYWWYVLKIKLTLNIMYNLMCTLIIFCVKFFPIILNEINIMWLL